MSNSESEPRVDGDVRELHLCIVCHGIYGPANVRGETLVQYCSCTTDTRQRWPGFDFNTFATLCACCGLEQIETGSRWSDWYCRRCDRAVRSLNDYYSAYVIPIGGHTIQGGRWGSDGIARVDSVNVRRFVQGLKSWSQRCTLVGTHSRRVVAETVAAGGWSSDPTLYEYRMHCYQFLHHRPKRIRELFALFDVPADAIEDALAPSSS